MSPLLQRALILYVPIFTVAALVVWRKPGRRWAGGLLLGFGWSVVTIVALSAVAHAAGWWKLSAQDHLWLGVPVDLLIGWALFWGPLPALLFPNKPFAAAAGVCWLDLWIMPALGGVLELGRHWVIGELLGVGFCLLPALLITAWTRDDRRLPLRVGAQVAIFGGLNLMVVLAVLRAHDPGWAADLAGSGTLTLGVFAQALAVPGVVAAASVAEFRRVGKGTPFPYDPPVNLVVSGPYAYIANPMQLAMTAGFVILAAFTGAFQLAFAGVVAAAIAAGIARWHEGEQLRMRFGDEWERYRRAVRRWIPHPRPVWAREAAYAPSTLYISATCPICKPVGRWIELKHPYGLRIVPAERHQTPVRRALYLPAGASRTQGADREGVAALAKALEHVNLAWAFAGWIVLFPGVSAVAQLIADAVGAGPRDLAASTTALEPSDF